MMPLKRAELFSPQHTCSHTRSHTHTHPHGCNAPRSLSAVMFLQKQTRSRRPQGSGAARNSCESKATELYAVCHLLTHPAHTHTLILAPQLQFSPPHASARRLVATFPKEKLSNQKKKILNNRRCWDMLEIDKEVDQSEISAPRLHQGGVSRKRSTHRHKQAAVSRENELPLS